MCYSDLRSYNQVLFISYTTERKKCFQTHLSKFLRVWKMSAWEDRLFLPSHFPFPNAAQRKEKKYGTLISACLESSPSPGVLNLVIHHSILKYPSITAMISSMTIQWIQFKKMNYALISKFHYLFNVYSKITSQNILINMNPITSICMISLFSFNNSKAKNITCVTMGQYMIFFLLFRSLKKIIDCSNKK